jgi:hypothetical protein
VTLGSLTVAAPVALALADGEEVGVGVGDADADPEAVAVADGSAEAEAVAVAPVALPDAFVAFFVGCFVACLVGAGLELGDADAGVAGAVPGGSPPPFCQENATVAPAGTVNEPTPREEYFHPEVPSDQYRPQ